MSGRGVQKYCPEKAIRSIVRRRNSKYCPEPEKAEAALRRYARASMEGNQKKSGRNENGKIYLLSKISTNKSSNE